MVAPSNSSRAAKARATLAGRVLEDLEAWWRTTYPRLYGDPFEPLQGYHPYTSRYGWEPPVCEGRVRPAYDDVAGNAWFCPDRDFISWDDEGLMPELYAEYGPVAIGMVFAHEMGHAIQARAAVDLDNVRMELQADCFAGAWLRRVTSGGSRTVAFDETTVDDAVYALMTVSDGIGASPDDVDAHGSAFDRVGALETGYERGVRTCAAYEERPPVVTLTPFRSAEEERTGGDVSLTEAITLSKDLLSSFWKAADRRMPTVTLRGSTRAGVRRAVDGCDGHLVFDGVGGVCRTGRTATITYDAKELRRLHDEIGDFASATVLAQAWSVIWQQATGRATSDTDVDAERQAGCAVGAWTRSLGPIGTDGGLSPGDLDELLYAVFDLPGPSTAFEVISSMRTGWTRGLRACG